MSAAVQNRPFYWENAVPGALTGAGAVLGAVIGSVVAPGVGTAAGTAAGAMIGSAIGQIVQPLMEKRVSYREALRIMMPGYEAYMPIWGGSGAIRNEDIIPTYPTEYEIRDIRNAQRILGGLPPDVLKRVAEMAAQGKLLPYAELSAVRNLFNERPFMQTFALEYFSKMRYDPAMRLMDYARMVSGQGRITDDIVRTMAGQGLLPGLPGGEKLPTDFLGYAERIQEAGPMVIFKPLDYSWGQELELIGMYRQMQLDPNFREELRRRGQGGVIKMLEQMANTAVVTLQKQHDIRTRMEAAIEYGAAIVSASLEELDAISPYVSSSQRVPLFAEQAVEYTRVAQEVEGALAQIEADPIMSKSIPAHVKRQLRARARASRAQAMGAKIEGARAALATSRLRREAALAGVEIETALAEGTPFFELEDDYKGWVGREQSLLRAESQVLEEMEAAGVDPSSEAYQQQQILIQQQALRVANLRRQSTDRLLGAMIARRQYRSAARRVGLAAAGYGAASQRIAREYEVAQADIQDVIADTERALQGPMSYELRMQQQSVLLGAKEDLVRAIREGFVEATRALTTERMEVVARAAHPYALESAFGAYGQRGYEVQRQMLGAEQQRLQVLRESYQRLLDQGFSPMSPEAIEYERSIRETELSIASSSRGLAEVTMGTPDFIRSTYLRAQKALYTAGYGGTPGAVRANLREQIAIAQRHLMSINAREAELRRSGELTETQARDLAAQREEAAMKLLSLQQEYDTGWLDRIISSAVNIPSGRFAQLYASNSLREAMMYGVSHRLLGGSREAMEEYRFAGPARFLSLLGGGSAAGFTEGAIREAMGGKLTVEVVIKDGAHNVLGETQKVVSSLSRENAAITVNRDAASRKNS